MGGPLEGLKQVTDQANPRTIKRLYQAGVFSPAALSLSQPQRPI